MPAPSEVSQLVDHLFRHEAGKMIATLTRIFGVNNLGLAEDVVHEALLKALKVWSYGHVPQNPSAWIMRVAKNLALDTVRREQNFRSKESEIAYLIEKDAGVGPDYDSLFLEDEIKDDQLRMMFVCCHPSLPREAQVALTLKTLCGFGETEIAAAFLTSRAAIAKRLVRAKQKLREERIPFEIPAGRELSPRLDAVLHVLYLLHNEGYKASQGEELVRRDLCEEAIRLTGLLLEGAPGKAPKTHALLALMLLNTARLAARVDGQGNLLLLAEQDRSLWDKKMIQRGLLHLNESAAGEEIGEFHLQAGIACCHCTAEKYADTDWPRILCLYDMLVEMNPSPVLALNRAVAVFKVHGAEAGLRAVHGIRDLQTLERYYLLHAVLAELYETLCNYSEAASCLRKALQLTNVKSEQAFLQNKLRGCAEKLDRRANENHCERTA